MNTFNLLAEWRINPWAANYNDGRQDTACEKSAQ
jgi:hypothetical protein